ncbi:MAG: helix-turn-helix domain-containing protein [Bryobacteraceae bacterium]
MYFKVLQLRLIAKVREQVKNGEITERSLARLTGISQPHIHNVLKGVRILSPETADQILHRLRITILDLIPAAESIDSSAARRYREVPVLEGLLGPGHASPTMEGAVERYPFLASQVAHLSDPVAVRLATDPRMAGVLNAGDLILLDRSEHLRKDPGPNGLYAVVYHGGSRVRRIKRREGGLLLLSEETRKDPAAWEYISLAGKDILDIVFGRLVWLGREMVCSGE